MGAALKRKPLKKIRAHHTFWRTTKLEQRGDKEGARKAYEKVLRSGVPGYGPNAGYLLAKMLILSGDLPGARSALEQTIKYYRDVPLRPLPADRDPLKPVPRDTFNWVFDAAVGLEAVSELQGDRDGARQAQALALELADTDELADFELRRGQELASFGHISGAKRAYQQAISANHPRWSAIAAHALGSLLAQQGDDEEACAAYEHAAAIGDARIAGSARALIENIRSRRA